MQHQLYAIYDKKAKVYTTLMFFRHVADALRNLSQVVVDQKNALCQFGEDFDLYLLFTVDDETGSVVPLPNPGPSLVINLGDLRAEIERKNPNGNRQNQSSKGPSEYNGAVLDSTKPS